MSQFPTKVYVNNQKLHRPTRKNIPSSSKANPSVRDICKLVVSDLTYVWQKASIPIFTKQDSLLKRLIANVWNNKYLTAVHVAREESRDLTAKKQFIMQFTCGRNTE